MTERLAVSAIIPAYQEETEISASLNRLLDVLDRTGRTFEILVVSDGSTDDTAQLARSTKREEVSVFEYPQNKGKGHALTIGVHRTTNPLVLFIDGDLDLDPSVIPRYFDIVESGRADGVVGSKTHPDSLVNYPWTRRVLSGAFRSLTRLMVGLDLGDTQTGLKVFRRDLLTNVVERCNSDGFTFDLELLCRLNNHGAVIVEAPVIIDYTFTSTVNAAKSLAAIRDLYKIRRWIRRES